MDILEKTPLDRLSYRSQKLLNSAHLSKKTQDASVARVFLAQRRKGAKETPGNAAALCVFAPLREKLLTLTKRKMKLDPYRKQRRIQFHARLYVRSVAEHTLRVDG